MVYFWYSCCYLFNSLMSGMCSSNHTWHLLVQCCCSHKSWTSLFQLGIMSPITKIISCSSALVQKRKVWEDSFSSPSSFFFLFWGVAKSSLNECWRQQDSEIKQFIFLVSNVFGYRVQYPRVRSDHLTCWIGLHKRQCSPICAWF